MKKSKSMTSKIRSSQSKKHQKLPFATTIQPCIWNTIARYLRKIQLKRNHSMRCHLINPRESTDSWSTKTEVSIVDLSTTIKEMVKALSTTKTEAITKASGRITRWMDLENCSMMTVALPMKVSGITISSMVEARSTMIWLTSCSAVLTTRLLRITSFTGRNMMVADVWYRWAVTWLEGGIREADFF